MSLAEGNRVLCARCGCRRGLHRAAGDLCPPTVTRGRPVPFPRAASDEPEDVRAWDEAIAAYWRGAASFRAS